MLTQCVVSGRETWAKDRDAGTLLGWPGTHTAGGVKEFLQLRSDIFTSNRKVFVTFIPAPGKN